MNDINITGYIPVKEGSGLHFLKVVVGTSTVQAARDFEVTRRTLRSLGVKFKEKEIIQVFGFPPVTPGVLNTLYGALYCKVNVKSMYIGEDNVLYIDVAQLEKAVRILNQPYLKRCPA